MEKVNQRLDSTQKTIIKNEDVDLIELACKIWDGRNLVGKIAAVFIFIGLITAFILPTEFKATSKLLPEIQDGNSKNFGGISGLAGLAGIDLGGLQGNSAMSPMIYPEIVSSLPFILKVMNDTIYFENVELHMTSFEYFRNIAKSSVFDTILKYTVGLPGLIKKLLSPGISTDDQSPVSNFFRFSKDEWKLIESFKNRIVISIDDETGIITIDVEMPDPVAAAQVARIIEEKMTQTVIQYKTDKAQENLEFVQETFLDAKYSFDQLQRELALANDRNRNVSTSIAQIELQKIENEYNIAFEVYKGLASQVEQAKIQLKEETPVFTVLEPARIPEKKHKPKRLMIIVLFGALGTIVAISKIILNLLIKIK